MGVPGFEDGKDRSGHFDGFAACRKRAHREIAFFDRDRVGERVVGRIVVVAYAEKSELSAVPGHDPEGAVLAFSFPEPGDCFQVLVFGVGRPDRQPDELGLCSFFDSILHGSVSFEYDGKTDVGPYLQLGAACFRLGGRYAEAALESLGEGFRAVPAVPQRDVDYLVPACRDVERSPAQAPAPEVLGRADREHDFEHPAEVEERAVGQSCRLLDIRRAFRVVLQVVEHLRKSSRPVHHSPVLLSCVVVPKLP